MSRHRQRAPKSCALCFSAQRLANEQSTRTWQIFFVSKTQNTQNSTIQILWFFRNSEKHRPFLSKKVDFIWFFFFFRYNKFGRFDFSYLLVQVRNCWNSATICLDLYMTNLANFAHKSKQLIK